MSFKPTPGNNEVFHWIRTELGIFEAYDSVGEECLLLMPKRMECSGVWTANLDDAKDVVELIRKMHRKNIKTHRLARMVRSLNYKIEKLRA